MKRKIFIIVFGSAFLLMGKVQESFSQTLEKPKERIYFVRDDNKKAIDVFIDGKLFTSYIYPSTIKKPVLYPVKTASGVTVTRSFPLEKVAGERVDHPHHVGVWFNYGNVNGLDFWNNSDAIDPSKAAQYGTIKLGKIVKVKNGNKKGVLEVVHIWVDYQNVPLLKEHARYVFSGDKNTRTIDRYTTLTALNKDLDMGDNKEGLFGMRVARALEMPSTTPEVFTDANGISTKVPAVDNTGVNGNYVSSTGKVGNDVWGTRAKWVNLSGEIKGEKVAIAIIDHKQNPGFPAYWHARGYGLFAANPLGQKEFSKGKEELGFKILAGKSAKFKYRMVIQSGEVLSEKDLDEEVEEFGESK
jgi:hypothetical protein